LQPLLLAFLFSGFWRLLKNWPCFVTSPCTKGYLGRSLKYQNSEPVEMLPWIGAHWFRHLILDFQVLTGTHQWHRMLYSSKQSSSSSISTSNKKAHIHYKISTS
jgi:hypothetical protein